MILSLDIKIASIYNSKYELIFYIWYAIRYWKKISINTKYTIKGLFNGFYIFEKDFQMLEKGS